jgi:glycosyltransferase involved in cell wall biosynthesis
MRIGMFASPARDKLNDLALEACRAAVARHGVDALAIGGDFRGGIPSTGYLSDNGLAHAMASRDLMLLPYSDGVDGRRTTFFAALHAGCAVLTTLAQTMTDFSTETGAFAFTSPDRPADFVDAAVHLSGNPDLVEGFARSGRSLFKNELAGEVLIRRVIRVYEQALA